MVETRRLTELVESALDRLTLPDGPVTVALSGGADSGALALLVARSHVDCTCLHVDHGLPASPGMARAAGEIADYLDLELQTVRVNLEPGASPENRARTARYEALCARDGPVITGHTQDDNAETVLLNLIRGTGPDGLGGIPRFRPPNIYRPMLRVSRSEAREIAALGGLPFVDDPMNSDLSLTRNRIRHAVLPLLAELNPRAVEALARASDALDRDVSYLRDLTPPSTGHSVAVGLVATLPRPLADRLLADFMRSCGVEVSADRLERVWSVVRGDSSRQDLAQGLAVWRQDALVVIG